MSGAVDLAAERSARAPATDWRGELRKRGERYHGDEANLLRAFRLAPELAGLVHFNEFANRVEFTRAPPWRELRGANEWTDEDDVRAQAWLQELGIDVRSRLTIAECAAAIARERRVHPVRRVLEVLTWDGQPRLHCWLAAYLDARDPPEYLEAVGAAWLISAVARVYRPGCQADHVLVLEGAQGTGKSRTARALAMRADWFTDSLPPVHDTDAKLQLAGRWIVELGELAAMRRSDVESLKAFISAPVDTYRPPYARRPVQVPRQTVFLGTTNETQYLRDPTGNRRFWPVQCGAIDVSELERAVPQLWAEALHEFRCGTPWHLTDAHAALAVAAQSERRLVTELEQNVENYLARLVAAGISETTMRDVLFSACGIDPGAADYVERAGRLGPQVAQAMHRAGWPRVGVTGRGEHRRTVYRRSTSQGFIG